MHIPLARAVWQLIPYATPHVTDLQRGAVGAVHCMAADALGMQTAAAPLGELLTGEVQRLIFVGGKGGGRPQY